MAQANKRVHRNNDELANQLLGGLKHNPSPVAKKALKGHEKVKNEHNVSATLPDEAFKFLWGQMQITLQRGMENYGEAHERPSIANEVRRLSIMLADITKHTPNKDVESYLRALVEKDLESKEPLAKQF